MFQTDLLKGRIVLITGGGTGLGRSMAIRLAELGAAIFLLARREQPLADTADEIRDAGGRCSYAITDVRDWDAVEKTVAAAEREFGLIDTLINNAAGNFIARTETLSPGAFAAVTGIALQGTFHCTLALGRRWIAGCRSGNVLNIVTNYASSGAGSGFVVPSACAKAGVLAMTRSLAVEWARYNIRLNAVAPGLFPTEGAWSRLFPTAEMEQKMKAAIPTRRFGRHEEMANLVAFLLSRAAEYINGECITVDGGGWLRGAGQFNLLTEFTNAAWEKVEASRKSK